MARGGLGRRIWGGVRQSILFGLFGECWRRSAMLNG
jgi:hypothetical protein